MRRIALLAAILVAALLWCLRGSESERAAPVDSPSRPGAGLATAVVGPDASPADAVPATEVHLRADGTIRLDGEVLGLDGLRRACRGRTTVTLRVDGTASWGHGEYVLAALERAGVRHVRFALPGGAAPAVFRSSFWERDVRHLPGGHWNGVIGVGDDAIAEPGLALRLAAERSDLRTRLGFEPVGVLYPDLHRTFAEVAPALLAFRDAGLELEFAYETGDVFYDWIPLPEVPDWSSTAFRAHRCWCMPYFSWVRLPVADMAEEDKNDDLDERLTIDLDAEGRVFHRGDPVSLEVLAKALEKRAEAYEIKQRRAGRSGYEPLPDGGKASKLYVLLRADADAPFRQVAWILHVLAEQHFYKVQFAARRAPAESGPGPCVGGLDGKLTVFLPTTNLPDIVTGWDRWIAPLDVYVDPGGTGVHTARAADAADLERLLRARKEELAADGERKVVVYLHVAAGVSHGQVISAVNAIHRHDLQKIDFAGTSPPEASIRLAKPLPR